MAVDDDGRRRGILGDAREQVLQHQGVELCHQLGVAVVALHEDFGGALGVRGLDAEGAGQALLVLEQQALFAAPGQVMQADAHMGQELVGACELTGLLGCDQNRVGEVVPVRAQVRGTGHPEDGLEVAQAARTLLAIGLQAIGRFVVARVAFL